MAKFGQRGVRLRATYVGGCQCITENDLRQFFNDLTRARHGEPQPMDVGPSHADAELELAEAGI
jgi:hypothetical protein